MHERTDAAERAFCILPFRGLSTDTFGRVVACCENMVPAIPGRNAHVPLDEQVNCEHLKSIRRDMLAGVRAPTCGRCWDSEDQGGYSYRKYWNDKLLGDLSIDDVARQVNPDGTVERYEPLMMEIALGNTCNLRCLMCSSHNSSSWRKEAMELGEITRDEAKALKTIDWYTDRNFHDQFRRLATDLKHISFWGGEPLIIDEHVDLLRICIDVGVSREITLKYASNLTKLAPELLEVWGHFRKVWISVSVDAYGDLNHYIRYPCDWARLEQNIQTLGTWSRQIPLRLNISATFQMLNILRLDELYPWVFNVMKTYGHDRMPYVGWVSAPEFMSCQVAPAPIKKLAFARQMEFIRRYSVASPHSFEAHLAERLKSHLARLVERVDTRWQERQWAAFCAYIDRHDAYRGTRVFDHCPEFADHWVTADSATPEARAT
jgi:sulfatase maturation enzyme AslB (radical SAM superfamily)